MKIFRFLLLIATLCSSITANAQTNSQLQEPTIPFREAPLQMAQDSPPRNAIYEFVEEQPEFPGGFSAWTKYVQEHLVYPDSALVNHIQGVVYLRAVVDTNGQITDIQLAKGVAGLNEAAINVLKNSPPWNPAKQNGKTVRTRMTIPVKFTLPEKAPSQPPSNTDRKAAEERRRRSGH